jgi:hypothetical protein
VPFDDLVDVLGITPAKVLPIHGQQVAFPGRVSARTGMLLLAISRAAAARGGERSDVEGAVAALGLTDADAAELEADILGPSAAVLDDLGVIGDARQHVMGTLVAWHLGGQEAAEQAWAAGAGSGKAQAPSSRATRRATAGRSSKTDGRAVAPSRAAAGGSSAARRRATKA